MLCIHCGRFSDAPLCPVCSDELEKQGYASTYQNTCPTCGRPLLDRAYPCPFCLQGFQAYGPYAGMLSALLSRFKAGEEQAVAKVLAPLYLPMLTQMDNPLLIPIPASRKGLSDRGFDQMLLISRLLKKKEGYPFLRLFAQKGEGQSKFLSLEQRKKRHTLSLLPNKSIGTKYRNEGYTFVLVDDICTTGSTLATCKALLAEQYDIDARSLVIALV